MSSAQALSDNLRALSLSNEAVDWLMDLWRAIQLFDDVADGDPVDRKTLDRVVWDTLIGMHTRAFWLRNAHVLIPVMQTAFLKWKAADTNERLGMHDERSFVWRAGFYDLILICIVAEQGYDAAVATAPIVMSLYGETYADYRKEFARA